MKNEKLDPYGHPKANIAQTRIIHLVKTGHPAADGYLYRGDGLSFPDEESLQLFLNTYCGMIIPGDNGHYEVRCYYSDFITILPQEYRELLLPEKTVYYNGKCRAKVQFNRLTNTVTLYNFKIWKLQKQKR